MLRVVKRRLFPIMALLPAVATTLAALTLAVHLVVRPEATSLEFAPVDGAGVGTIDDGDLLVLEGADRRALADAEAEGFRLYRLAAVAGDDVTEVADYEATVTRAEIGRRVTHTRVSAASTTS